MPGNFPSGSRLCAFSVFCARVESRSLAWRTGAIYRCLTDDSPPSASHRPRLNKPEKEWSLPETLTCLPESERFPVVNDNSLSWTRLWVFFWKMFKRILVFPKESAKNRWQLNWYMYHCQWILMFPNSQPWQFVSAGLNGWFTCSHSHYLQQLENPRPRWRHSTCKQGRLSASRPRGDGQTIWASSDQCTSNCSGGDTGTSRFIQKRKKWKSFELGKKGKSRQINTWEICSDFKFTTNLDYPQSDKAGPTSNWQLALGFPEECQVHNNDNNNHHGMVTQATRLARSVRPKSVIIEIQIPFPRFAELSERRLWCNCSFDWMWQ